MASSIRDLRDTGHFEPLRHGQTILYRDDRTFLVVASSYPTYAEQSGAFDKKPFLSQVAAGAAFQRCINV